MNSHIEQIVDESIRRPPVDRPRSAWQFAVLGAFLGLGSPLGMALIRFVTGNGEFLFTWAQAEVRALGIPYLYMCLGTVTAFGILGYWLGRRNERLGRDLVRAHEVSSEFMQISRTDALTGLLARGYLIERLEDELKRAQRHHAPLACLFVDVDGLKALNDGYGHLAGDRALQAVAHVLKTEARVTDIVGRIGGDEFIAVLPQTASQGAYVAAERIRREVESCALESAGTHLRLTVSIGVYAKIPSEVSVENCLRGADEALHESKTRGKDRTVIADKE